MYSFLLHTQLHLTYRYAVDMAAVRYDPPSIWALPGQFVKANIDLYHQLKISDNLLSSPLTFLTNNYARIADSIYFHQIWHVYDFPFQT